MLGILQCQNQIMNFGFLKILNLENAYLAEKLNISGEKEKLNVSIKKKLIKNFLSKLVLALKMIGNAILDFTEKLKEDPVYLLLINLKKMILLIY